MNKDIVSFDYIWEDIRLGWEEAKEAMTNWKLAKDALKDASNLLGVHSDVSSLLLGRLSSNINNLESDTDDFIVLAREMHDELNYNVDRPFYKQVMKCVTDIYAENPMDIKLEGIGDSGEIESVNLEELFRTVLPLVDLGLHDQLFEAFESLDEDVPGKDMQELILESITEYYDGVYTEFMTARDVDSVKFAEYEASRDIFIQYYEMLYPGRSDKLDELLNCMATDATKDYQEDIDNIKFITYSADERYQTLFFAYIDDMDIKDHNYTEYDKDKKKMVAKQYWSSGSNTLTLNFEEGHDNGLSDPRGPYTVFFHEVGHGIDDMCRSEEKYFLWWKTSDDLKIVEEYRNEENLSLNDVAVQDVTNYLTENAYSIANSKGITLTEEECTRIVNELLDTSINSETISTNIILDADGTKNIDLNKVYTQMISDVAKELQGARIGGISDVYGGVTTNAIVGNYQHGDEYWFEDNEQVHLPSTELFAHYFAYNMTGSVEQMEYMENYLPNANEMMDEMVELLEKEIIGD